MTFEYKDYYKLIGVDRSASTDEIRKTYRKLARKYHPDVNPGNKPAEEKFKEINEAYDVLSDHDKRKRYDELGSGWQHGQQFQPPPGFRSASQQRGSPDPRYYSYSYGGDGFSDFFQSFFGGKGFSGFEGERVQEVKGQDVEGQIVITIEDASSGVTRSISLDHDGKSETYHVKIPPGLRSGAKLRLTGRGKASRGGGARGDLYLRVLHAEHPFLRFEGDDLIYELEIAPWEAVLCSSITFLIMKQKVKLKIPPGTQSGTRLRLKGQGFKFSGKQPGDLIVETNIEVPKAVSDEERKAWEKLASTSTFNPRT